jgi:hypothetical protein
MWTHLPHPPHRGFAHLYLSFHSMISLDRRGETDRIAIHHLPLFESIGCSNEDHNRHWIHIRKNSLITGKPNEFSSSLSLSSSLYHLSPLPRARSEPTLSIRLGTPLYLALFVPADVGAGRDNKSLLATCEEIYRVVVSAVI